MNILKKYICPLSVIMLLGLFSINGAAQSIDGINPKSPFQKRYLLYSFVVPGLGEYMMDEKDYLKYFIATDVVLLLGAYSLDYYASSYTNDAINIAKQRAGISGLVTDRGFLISLGNYNSLSDYNNKVMQDRSIADLYPEDPAHHWQWLTTDDRYLFEEKRQNGELLKQSVPFVIGAILINHTVSMFNVLLLYKKSKKESTEKVSSIDTNIWANPVDESNRFGKGIQLNIQFSF